MKGVPKSLAQENDLLQLVAETIGDGYRLLSELDPTIVRKDDSQRDIAYLHRRFDAEGITFLTVGLPMLGDWADRYVWGEKVERVAGFKPYDGLHPTFLRPFWVYLERLKLGVAEDDRSAELYRIVRTILHGLKKLDAPLDPSKVQAKLDDFKSIERELSDFRVIPSLGLQRSQELLEHLFGTTRERPMDKPYTPKLRSPRHGPGAVAGYERHNEKWTWSTLYESVHAVFPYWEYLFPVRSVVKTLGEWQPRSRRLQLAGQAALYRNLVRVPEPTARLLTVPKDSRGPRVISCEPKELMYLQQGVSNDLVHFLGQHDWTRGHINFDDQEVNADLALSASRTKEWDTIDLSDASDRVSMALVEYLVPERVAKYWLALRSTATVLPSGERVPLHKFAPMGSALCFPVEALVFWAIAVGEVWNLTNDLELAIRSVYVYGDDIIVARGYTDSVMNALEAVYLKVNRAKSFVGDHPFRESCGIEAWKGHVVTPYRTKKFPPRRPTDGTACVAWLKYAENCQYTTPGRSKYMLSKVEAQIGPIPRTPVPQPYLSFVTRDNVWSHTDFKGVMWSVPASYWTAIVPVLKSKKTRSPLPDWSRLQKDLVEGLLEGDPTVVVDRASTQIRKMRKPVTYVGLETVPNPVQK